MNRYSGLLNSTVLYWLKDTISGMNFRFTLSEIYTLPPLASVAKIEP